MFTNSGINKIFLIGYIDKAPRVHRINDGFGEEDFLCFPLLTVEQIKKNGVAVEHQEIHQIKFAQPVLSVAVNKLVKGQLIHIEGKIQTRAFTDEEGIKRYKAEILVSRFQVLTPAAGVTGDAPAEMKRAV